MIVFAGIVRTLFVSPSITISLVVVKVIISVELLRDIVSVATSRCRNSVIVCCVSDPNTGVKAAAVAISDSNIIKVQVEVPMRSS